MVGWREAIYFVATASVADVKKLATEGDTASLRAVCRMRLTEPGEWRALLRDLGLVEAPKATTPPALRAIQLWREDFWTIEALAKETGLTYGDLDNLRRRQLGGATWATKYAAPRVRAFKLLP